MLQRKFCSRIFLFTGLDLFLQTLSNSKNLQENISFIYTNLLLHVLYNKHKFLIHCNVQYCAKVMQVNFDEFPGFPDFSTKFRLQRNYGDKSPKFRDTYCFIPRESSRDNSRCSNFRSELSGNFRFVCQFSSISGQCFAAFEIQLDIHCKPSLWCGAREKQLCVCVSRLIN